MPQYSRDDVVMHERFVASRRFYLTQLKHMDEIFEQARLSLQRNSLMALEQAAFMQQKKQAKTQELLAFSQIRLELAQRVITWKEELLEKSRQASVVNNGRKELQKEWETGEAQRAIIAAEALRRRVAEYHAEQKHIREMAEVVSRQGELEAAVEALAQTAHNETRTQFRKQLLTEKEGRKSSDGVSNEVVLMLFFPACIVLSLSLYSFIPPSLPLSSSVF